jgi:hypothetical protein
MYVIPKEEAFRGLFFHNYIVPSGATLPRSVLTTLGGFDVRLKNSEDRDMWFRVARDYPIGYLDEIGFTRRLRASSMMAAPAARLVPSKLLALRKQLAAGLPTDLARQAKRLIAGNLYSVGHEHQNQGNLREARRFFIQSNREQANLPALRGLALTVLGSRLGRLAKQFIGRD